MINKQALSGIMQKPMILKSHTNVTIVIRVRTVTYLVHTLLYTTSKVEVQ